MVISCDQFTNNYKKENEVTVIIYDWQVKKNSFPNIKEHLSYTNEKAIPENRNGF
jgi:hypothetical protein